MRISESGNGWLEQVPEAANSKELGPTNDTRIDKNMRNIISPWLRLQA